MNKTEFIREVAEKADLSKKQAEAAYDAMMETIVESLKGGEKIQLVGFGSFDLKEKPAREVYNPLTGKKQKIAASKVPSFKLGKAFKDLF
ncbi:MAG TPA: HU family DNA-binding protein [Clostridiales bacterium]|nr:HU family DNA-binding protein [Clostridiales bacterium]